jgi:hypothetical protein
MKYLKILLLVLIASNFSFAQNQGIVIIGKVVHDVNQQPVEFATVMLGDKKTKAAITGVTTELDGTFQAETDATDFYLKISQQDHY